MPLMISISGIRGVFGDGLDPVVLAKFTAAYGTWVRRQAEKTPVVVVGRDARVTGELCASIVAATLRSTGCAVVDAGLATTPTVEMAVLAEKAAGGIILSASHNPAQWNALKLLNEKGEFLSAEEGQEVLDIADRNEAAFVSYDRIGGYRQQDYLNYHIEKILALPYIEPEKIAARKFRIVVDGINSVGGVAIPALLRALGVKGENVTCLNCDPTGLFAHTPEPLPENLTETTAAVAEAGADLGIVVDPDADRLAFVENGGRFFGEELTQVVAADFIWRKKKGPFATNLSSSRAVEDVAQQHGAEVYRSAVGEINVVKKMQKIGAVIGGEGNGGVILPDLHYGRDALAGVALVLQYLAERDLQLSDIRAELPTYVMAKKKMNLGDVDADAVLAAMAEKYAGEKINTEDGVKIDFPDGWVHLRKSNTEPIIRIYTEAPTPEAADELGERFISEMKSV